MAAASIITIAMIRKLVISIALILPALFVFKSLFFPGPLAWGDAPHFYPEEIRQLVGEPLAWDSRGNSFGGINSLIFIWPLMFIYGLIGNNDLAVRILFYFPSIMLAGLGIYFLTRYLKFAPVVSFFSVLVYLINTYYLLLIDGGQAGVALAYGLFPLILLFLRKFLDGPNLKSFFLSLMFLVLGGIADPRVTMIAIVTIFFWQALEQKFTSLIYLLPLIISWLGINMYWLYPLFKNGDVGLAIVSGAVKLKWYYPLALFSPHWPQNLFGQVSRPPFYFVGIPILILLGGILNKEKKFLILFLIFMFLSFGALPLGTAFRDSTKFFMPLILFGGILIGQALEKRSIILHLISYIYILFLVYPGLIGKMNFVLSNRPQPSGYERIYEKLKADNGFYRSVWFPERHPMTYETDANPALDARDLVRFWPFASLNASEDVFNFLNNENFIEWLRVLGVRNLILSDNPREISKSTEDKKSWDTILRLVDGNKNLTKTDWGVGVPIYTIEKSYPRFYTVDTLTIVVGSFLSERPRVPAVYLEDGKWNPKILQGKDPASVKIFFNGKNKTDLAMSFLQKYFISPEQALKNEWAVYSKDQNLKYKYELLIRGVKFTDFDYAKGLAFSTQKSEKMEFKFEVPESGEYVFAKRIMIPSEGQSSFKWETTSLNLQKGDYAQVIENNSDLQILNVVALVPKSEFNAAFGLADAFLTTFSETKLEEIKTVEIESLKVNKVGSLRYSLENKGKNFWVIYNEKYDSQWKLKRGRDYFESVPVFSMINGFYIKNDWRDLGVEFKGQEVVRWGIYWSAVSILALLIILLIMI